MSRCQHIRTWPLSWRLHHGVGWYQQRRKTIPAYRYERIGDRRLLQGWDPGHLRQTIRWPYSSSSWTTPRCDRVVQDCLQQKTIVRSGLASTLIWFQPDRACLKQATGGDIVVSGSTSDSRETGKCSHWTSMEQSWDDSHPETHWKHETPLASCMLILKTG